MRLIYSRRRSFAVIYRQRIEMVNGNIVINQNKHIEITTARKAVFSLPVYVQWTDRLRNWFDNVVCVLFRICFIADVLFWVVFRNQYTSIVINIIIISALGCSFVGGRPPPRLANRFSKCHRLQIGSDRMCFFPFSRTMFQAWFLCTPIP